MCCWQSPLHQHLVSYDLSSPVPASPTYGWCQAATPEQARWRYSKHHPQDQVCRHSQTPAPKVQWEGEERHCFGWIWGCFRMSESKNVPCLRHRTLQRLKRQRSCLLFDSNNRQTSSSSLSMCMWVFFIPTLSPVMVTDWNWLMVLSVLRLLLIKGVSGSDSLLASPLHNPSPLLSVVLLLPWGISAGLVPLANCRHNTE